MVVLSTVVCRAWRAQIRHDGRVGCLRGPSPPFGETSTPRRRASYKAAFCSTTPPRCSALHGLWRLPRKPPMPKERRRTKSERRKWCQGNVGRLNYLSKSLTKEIALGPFITFSIFIVLSSVDSIIFIPSDYPAQAC